MAARTALRLVLSGAPRTFVRQQSTAAAATTAVASFLARRPLAVAKASITPLSFPVRATALRAYRAAAEQDAAQDVGETLNPPSKDLFVAGLPFFWEDHEYRSFFENVGEPVNVVVPRRNGRTRGFAICRFATVEAATAAYRELSGSSVEGRVLKVDFAAQREQVDEEKVNPGDCKTLNLYNLSYSVTKEEITQYFSEHNPVDVSFPQQRTDGRPTGAASVTFASPEEADAAIASKEHTDFMGRRLVIRYYSPPSSEDPKDLCWPVDQPRDIFTSNSVFVRNIGRATAEQLRTHFEAYGQVMAVKVLNGAMGRLNSALVEFASPDGRDEAIESGTDTKLSGRTLRVEPRRISPDASRPVDRTRLFVRGFREGTTADELGQFFHSFGRITSAFIPEPKMGRNPCAFIQFENEEDAGKACSAMNHADFNGSSLFVHFAKPRTEPRARQFNESY